MSEAAFFDLDKTIIAKSATLAFTRTLYRAGMVSSRILAKAGLAQAYYQRFGAAHHQLERVKDELGTLTTGWSKDEVVALVEETVDQVVAPLVYEEALAIIAEHEAMGRRVVVISASPEEIVKPLCRYLGIRDVIATRAEVDEAGRYTGRLELYAYGSEKAEAMREMAHSAGIDLAASYAYSDSITDLPMLELVGNPVVVNPDPALAEVAARRGWEVRHFRSVVTLKERLAANAMPGAAIAAGLAVAVASYWALNRWRAS